MKMTKKYLVLAICVLLLIGWFAFNPHGKFGPSCYAITNYSGIPFIGVDVKMNAGGIPLPRSGKSHFIKYEEVKKMLDAAPDYLIIGTGYDNTVKVDPRIEEVFAVKVIVAPTPEALLLFNMLKGEGKRVAAVIHSTC